MKHEHEQEETTEGEAIFAESDELTTGVAIVDGPTFSNRPVHFVDVDGDAVTEGDIIVGQTEVLRTHGVEADPEGTVQHGVGLEQERYRWTNGTVPYVIQSGFSARDRKEITDAIAHWHDKTEIRLVNRTNQPNYVVFTPSNQCSSYVGMRGGPQPIKLAPGCSLGNTIHEIGHAVGLWHEQSREDRDSFITVHYQNIRPEAIGNFNRHVTDGVDVGGYDYGSLMHYPRKAFSKNGLDTITPKRSGVTIGQRVGLSAGDIATVRWMYPNLERSRTWQGVQFQGSVPAGATRTWSTHSWPTYWYVNWSVMPLTPIGGSGRQLSVEVSVRRQAERLATYYVQVKNHSSKTVTFEARYAILGWSRAARDEIGDESDGQPQDGGSVDVDLVATLDETSEVFELLTSDDANSVVSAGAPNGVG